MALTLVQTTKLTSLRAQRLEEEKYQARIVRARLYDAGSQDTKLPDRLKEFLASAKEDTFRLNICRTVVGAVAEKLTVTDWLDYSTGARDADSVADWAWSQWLAMGLDINQDEAHAMAVRDGEAFVFVDWDEATGALRAMPHQRFTSTDIGGDNYGCRAFYTNDDPNQPMLYASKYWTEYDEKGKPLFRRNSYYPDEIVRYQFSNAGWTEIGRDAWPAGVIPIVHFRNVEMCPEAVDVWVLQDAVNKAMIDAILVGDRFGFPIPVALGWYPTTDGKVPASDGSNVMNFKPGNWIGTAAEGGQFQIVEADKLMQAYDVIDKQISYAAMISDTPLSRFSATKQVASDETLKQQDEPLNIKVEKRQARFGSAWQQVMNVARRLANTFGRASIDEEVVVYPLWQPARRVDPLAKYTEAQLQQGIGLPREWIWANTLGLTQEQIAAIQASPEYQARIQMLSLGLAGGQVGA
jgi:hypothetical protein